MYKLCNVVGVYSLLHGISFQLMMVQLEKKYEAMAAISIRSAVLGQVLGV